VCGLDHSGTSAAMSEGVSLALVSALAFGLCDFVAGIAARRLSFWLVNVVSLLASAAGAWALVGAGGDPISRSALVLRGRRPHDR
jgi:hypothetical protein